MIARLNSKVDDNWDISNEGKPFSYEEFMVVQRLNLYKRQTLQRKIETIETSKRLKRRYISVHNESIGFRGNIEDRNRSGVNWFVVDSKTPYTTEELILMAKIATYKRAPQGSVTSLAAQFNRTPWALTVRISKMRKTGEWKQWLDYEKKQMARA